MDKRKDPAQRVITLIQENWAAVADPQLAVTVMLRRLARLLEENARRTLAGFALSTTEFELLAAIRAHQPPHEVTPTELYDALLISSGGLTKVLKALEQRGLVERPASASDRRSRPIRLTDAGCALAEQAMLAVRAADGPAFQDGVDLEILVHQLGELTRRAERLRSGEEGDTEAAPSAP